MNAKLSLCVALTAALAVSAAAQTPLTTERVASGLSRPVFVTAPVGDTDRLFILEKRGFIRILDLTSNTVLATPFLNIDSIVGGGTSNSDERGLLGLAFDPDYANNGYFYVNYTNNSSDTVVARYSVDPNDPNQALPASQEIILLIDQPFSNHNGGWMAFGPQGYLWIATGDGGSGCDPSENAQNINNLLGNLLRIDVSVAPGYAIPIDNPFVGLPGRDEIWSFGLRNPFRNAFDAVTGDLYIADVGQGAWEEVNFLANSGMGGENFGWDCMEGNHCASDSGCSLADSPCTCFDPGLVDPIQEYSRGGSPFRCAITGGEVYRGCAIPDLRGTYFYADYCSDQIWSFRYLRGNVNDFQERTVELAPSGALIRDIVSFGADANGEMYIVDQGSGTNGEIFRIIPDGPVDPPAPFNVDTDFGVDFVDYSYFETCMTGPAEVYTDCLCDHFDADTDSDADLVDFAGLQIAFDG